MSRTGALLSIAICFGATGAWATTNQFRGVNWADSRDNFQSGVLYVSGLASSDTYSSALLRATDEVTATALQKSLETDRRLNLTVMSEKAYYDLQTVSSKPIQFLGIFVCIIMAVGSCFAAMNTMYAAVSRRATEVGTLRVLGFSR